MVKDNVSSDGEEKGRFIAKLMVKTMISILRILILIKISQEEIMDSFHLFYTREIGFYHYLERLYIYIYPIYIIF
jgi:hypothetical protein